MIYLLSFFVSWWYCFDDHLAEWVGVPALGTVPLWVWILVVLGCISAQLSINARRR